MLLVRGERMGDCGVKEMAQTRDGMFRYGWALELGAFHFRILEQNNSGMLGDGLWKNVDLNHTIRYFCPWIICLSSLRLRILDDYCSHSQLGGSGSVKLSRCQPRKRENLDHQWRNTQPSNSVISGTWAPLSGFITNCAGAAGGIQTVSHIVWLLRPSKR